LDQNDPNCLARSGIALLVDFPVKEQLAVQKLLTTQFEALRKRNPQYSRRAFSRKLGLSAGAISELFSGQRNISAKLAERLSQVLGLDPQERSELLALFPKKAKRKKLSDDSRTVAANYLQLTADQFRVISEWYHFAILTLMRTVGFKNDPDWIAQRLNMSSKNVIAALNRMKRLGMVHEDQAGLLSRQKARYRTSDDIANDSVAHAHSQYLNKALEALERPVHQRDFTSIMLSIRPDQLPRAKEMIRKFQDDLSAELEVGPQTEVFQMCIQVFPLTQI